MTKGLINFIDSKICKLDEATKQEINLLIVALDEVEPLDLAIEITELDFFQILDTDDLSVMIETEIIRLKQEEKTTLFQNRKKEFGNIDLADTFEVYNQTRIISEEFEGNDKALLTTILLDMVVENAVNFGRKNLITEISKMK